MLTVSPSQAHGPALKHSTSTLSHFRAVKQLASVLGCENSWPAVEEAIKRERAKPDNAWARRCFEGIETALIDDGLDPSNVHPYQWHDCLTRSKCKRIVRIERIAEGLITVNLETYRSASHEERHSFPSVVKDQFILAMNAALADPEVAGFKSVICYRTGLAIPTSWDEDKVFDAMMSLVADEASKTFPRLEHEVLSPYFVHLISSLMQEGPIKKPFQFHTGLGDNDINLGLSNPSHMQPYIQRYPDVPIVLLHASYPFTTEAGYLASVYENGRLLSLKFTSLLC